MFKKLCSSGVAATARRLPAILAVLLIIGGSALGASCRGEASVTTTPQNTVTATFPLTVTDDLGRSVTVASKPQRIVSLAPSNTEILYDLGLGDQLVGNTTWCDYPPDAFNKEKVGGYSDIDIEKVVSLDPDLILAEDIHKAEVIPALEKLGFTTFALLPHNLEEIMQSIVTIGRLTGTDQRAAEIVADMQQRINYITDKTAGISVNAKPSVLYVIWHDPLTSVGGNTPIHQMINLAGGKSIVADDVIGWPTLALERVIDADPQIIVANVESYEGGDAPLQAMFTEPRLAGVAAVTQHHAYGINASLTNRPVARIIQGLEWLAAIIHPELFPEFVAEYMGSTG